MASSNDGARVMAEINARIENMTRRARRTVQEAADKGRDLTKQHIETRGTAKSGKRGRIETGAMLNSVSSGTVSADIEEVVTRFGYENSPYWTQFQEPGFIHLSGVTVEGTYALQDAAEEVFKDLRRDIGDAVTKA